MKVRAGRRTIQVSHPDKCYFPEDGYTKGDLVEYYTRIAPVMVPHLRERLLTVERYPDGIDKQRFFQKDTPAYFPSWIHRKSVPKKGGRVSHVVCNDQATLVYLANQSCITHHVSLGRIDRLEYPDQLIVDLDPSDDDFDLVRKTARFARSLFEELGLVPYVKSTGSRGLHVMAPIDRRIAFDEVRAFAHEMALLIEASDPSRLTVESRKAQRGGRLFLDVGRNAWAQTVVAPYSVRARPGAPVAAPVEWDEVDDPGFGPRRYSIADISDKVAAEGDPWKGYRRKARSLTRARRRLDELLAESRSG